jgi:hypothetical protein
MVAIFRDLENKIMRGSTTWSDINHAAAPTPSTSSPDYTTTINNTRRSLARFVTATSSGGSTTTSSVGGEPDETSTVQSSMNTQLGVGQLANFVSPDSKLAKDSPKNAVTTPTALPSMAGVATNVIGATNLPPVPSSTISSASSAMLKLPQLLTPMDDEFMSIWNATSSSSSSSSSTTTNSTTIGPKEIEAIRKRDIGRREKFMGDLCLLAGSPLDAYERYLKAAEICKLASSHTATTSSSSTGSNSSMDPLWYAAALEGCAAAHIVMAEVGGYGYVLFVGLISISPPVLLYSLIFIPSKSVDDYLENNFQLPEEIMSLAREDSSKKQSTGGNKQTLPEVVFALCDEALNILNRHEKLGNLYAELLLKLAIYCAEEAETHLRCRWGEGPYCYVGESSDEPRWETTSVSKLKFNPLRTKDGYSMIAINTHNRIKKLCELLSAAVSIGSLDPPTRVDVAVRCARICLVGVKVGYYVLSSLCTYQLTSHCR